MRPRRASWLRWLLILFVFGLLAVGGVAWYLGGQLIAPANHAVTLPDDFQAETVTFAGAGHSIKGSWRDFGGDSPVVLLLHGIRADRASMVPRARLLTERGFSVLMIDLQAHGETPGEHITLGWREAADVRAARDWIQAHAPGRRVGVIGTSLGGAAVLLAPQPVGFDAVVLESVYPRLSLAVENRIRMRLGWLAPLLKPFLLMQLKLRLQLSTEQLEPIRFIDTLGAPVLVAGGSDDMHTTKDETIDLYDAARSPKNLWIARGAAHQDLARFDERDYVENVVAFLRMHLGEPHDVGTLARVAAANLPRNPVAGSGKPSAAVQFFAEDLQKPLALELSIARLAKLCLEKYASRCERMRGVEGSMAIVEKMFELGPPFEAALGRVQKPDVATYEALEREVAELAIAFQRELGAFDQRMFTRLLAVMQACPSESDDNKRRALSEIAQINFARFEQRPREESGSYIDALNNDAKHMSARLREQWLTTTCRSAVELSDVLLRVYSDKVRPLRVENWRTAEIDRIGFSFVAVWQLAFALAREVDPSLERRVLELESQRLRVAP